MDNRENEISLTLKELELSRESLRESERRLREITDNMLDMIIKINKDGILLYATSSHKDILGYTPGSLIGKSVFDYLHPDDLNMIKDGIKIIVQDHSIEKARFRFLHANGSYLWLESFAKPLLNENNQVEYFVFSTRNITEQKRIEEELVLSEERFSKAFNFSPYPMSITTLKDGRYIDVNNSYLELLGCRREEIIGHKTVELFWLSEEDRKIIFQKMIEQGYNKNLEINFQTKSGEIRTGLLSAELVEIYKEQCALSVINDITERKLLENELKKNGTLSLVFFPPRRSP